MTRRSNALPLLLLTAAATLVILIGLAIACAPASPSAQSNTPDSPSTHTPTPTHTPAPSPTKYVREDSPFDSFLAGEVAKRKARGPGFLGQGGSDAEELIVASIFTVGSLYPPEYNYPGIMRYLKEQGVTPLDWTFDDPESGMIEAELTLDTIIELSEMRGVSAIFSRGQQYPGMGIRLSGVYSEYDAGLITAEEAVASLGGYQNGNIPVEIWIENPTGSGNTDRVLRFLKDNRVTVDHLWNVYRPYFKGDITKAIPPTDSVFTSVPWSLVPRLAKLPGIEVRSNPDTSDPHGRMEVPGQQSTGVASPADAHGATICEPSHARGYNHPQPNQPDAGGYPT